MNMFEKKIKKKLMKLRNFNSYAELCWRYCLLKSLQRDLHVLSLWTLPAGRDDHQLVELMSWSSWSARVVYVEIISW